MSLSNDQWVTVAVAAVGGAVALAGILLGPRVHARAERRNRITERRIDVYSDLLLILREAHSNALKWSATPLAELSERSDEELSQIDARVSVVGSERVYHETQECGRVLGETYRALARARSLKMAEPDGPEAIDARTRASDAVDRAKVVIEHLEETISKEMKR